MCRDRAVPQHRTSATLWRQPVGATNAGWEGSVGAFGGLSCRKQRRGVMHRRASEKALVGALAAVSGFAANEGAVAAVLRGGVNGADVWRGLTGDWGPLARAGGERHGRERSANQSGTPRPRCPRAPGPRAPSLTGAGVSAGRRPRRRRRRRRSGETRGPDRKCRPLPLPGSPAPPACPPARKRKSRPSPRRRRGGAERGGGGGDRDGELRLRTGSGTRTGIA